MIVAEYEAFKDRIGTASNLTELVAKLETYDWMPVEDEDFVVKFEPRTANNGVNVESEIFYIIHK